MFKHNTRLCMWLTALLLTLIGGKKMFKHNTRLWMWLTALALALSASSSTTGLLLAAPTEANRLQASASQVSTLPKQVESINSKGQRTTPLDSLLNADGTLNLATGFNGSVDPTGWEMTTGSDGQPRFVQTGAGGDAKAVSAPVQASASGQELPMSVPEDVNWDSRFAMPGVNNTVRAIAVSGAKVYVGGDFTMIGGATGISANHVAVWNSVTGIWSTLGIGTNNGVTGCTGASCTSVVNAIAVQGANVYVGGNFTATPVGLANNIAKWDSLTSAWSVLGSSPTNNGTNGPVYAIVVSNMDVYVGGAFTVTTISSANIAKWGWNGSTWAWSNMGTWNLVNDPVRAIAVSGCDVYIGGDFTTPGNHIAKWNCTGAGGWSTLDLGVGTGSSTVNAIAVSGPYVFVGGNFTTAGTLPIRYIARWKVSNSTWEAIGETYGPVNAIAISGVTVYVGGAFSGGSLTGLPRYIARGTVSGGWGPVGGYGPWNGVSPGPVNAIGVNGPDMYAGGAFVGTYGSGYHGADGVSVNYIAKWTGSSWSALGSGVKSPINAIAVYGTDVYVGGNFIVAGGGIAANNIAKWNTVTNSWSALGGWGPYNGTNGPVYAIAVIGSDVYVGGSFSYAGRNIANNIAKWSANGSATGSWSALEDSALNNGVNGNVHAITALGADLYVGGSFSAIGAAGPAANRIVKWNTLSPGWSTLGSTPNDGVTGGNVLAIAASGNNLYVGGDFTTLGASGPLVNHIAKCDALLLPANCLSTLGTSPNDGVTGRGNAVYAIAVSGSDVYVGGTFDHAGGTTPSNTADNIAKWTGCSISWSAPGTGTGNNAVLAIGISGPDVYVGGNFSTGGPANRIAKWSIPSGSNAYSWSALGSGVTPTGSVVNAIGMSGNDVYVGGQFTTVGDKPSSNFGLWHAP